MTKDDFKGLFLELTEYTIPFGKENTLEPILPNGWKKDSVGNYYYEIGKSETLFTTHLDTYSKEYKKIKRYQDSEDEYIIFTDGNTILGGDNKLGCTILIGMIENKIPGTYYFFLGEEPIISGGCWGSRNALKNNPDFFKKFKRCIAFDRRGYGSIVIRQMARMSASRSFMNAIANKLKELGNIEFDSESSYGYYTDTATFMDVIPECTNISAGGFGEHTTHEYVDLNYTYNVYKTALKIKWDELPTERTTGEVRFSREPNNTIKNFKKFLYKDIEKELDTLLDDYDLVKTSEIEKGGVLHLTYSEWLQEKDYEFWIKNGRLYMDSSLKNQITLNNLEKILKRQS